MVVFRRMAYLKYSQYSWNDMNAVVALQWLIVSMPNPTIIISIEMLDLVKLDSTAAHSAKVSHT